MCIIHGNEGKGLKKINNLKQKVKEMGLKQKTMTFVMVLFIMSIIITSIMFFFMYQRMKKETIQKAMENVVIQKKGEIETYFENLITQAYSIGFSSWMQNLFLKKNLDWETEQDIEESVKYFMSSLSDMNSGIKLVAIMSDGRRLNGSSGSHLDYSIDIKEQSWYPEFLKAGKYMEEGKGKGIYTKGDGWFMNIYYPINNKYSMDQEGILVITIPKSSIDTFINMGIRGEYMTIKDENGQIISSGLTEKVSNEINSRRYFVRNEKIDIGGKFWNMEIVMDTTSLVVDSHNIWIGFLFAFVIAACSLIATATVFSKYLTVPILECRDAMKKIRNNHMGIKLDNYYHDEIGELIEGFNEMSNSIFDLIERNKIISTLQKETEYQMLLQQINPHFLYNTLEIINGLILNHKEKAAVSVCETLGQIFHYNMRQNKWIKVKEEMAYIRQYLLIMEYKIPELTIYYEIDESAEDKKILKAILQPLVENCIKHGFAQKLDECCISITILDRDENLEISIMDNGIGITKEKYIQLMKALQDIRENTNKRNESSVHIGVWNVFHRLYLEYGEYMLFQIIAKENVGTRIQIRLPGGGEKC